MKCKQVRQLMGVYLYGDLAPEEMRQLRLHTRDCAECREDLASRGRVTSLIDDRSPRLDDAEKQQMIWSVSSAVNAASSKRRRPLRRLLPAFATGCVLVLCVGVGVYIGMHFAKANSVPVAATPPGISNPIAVPRLRPHLSGKPVIPDNVTPPQKTADSAGADRQAPLGAIVLRQLNADGTIASRSNAQGHVTHDKPAAASDSNTNPATANNEKLPRVDSPNDAQKR